MSLLRGGLGLIAAGFGFLVVSTNIFRSNNAVYDRYAGLAASTFLALAIAPWIAEIFQRKRLFAPAATFSRSSWTHIFGLFSFSIYLLLIVGAAVYFFTPWGHDNWDGKIHIAFGLIGWGILFDVLAFTFTSTLALGMGLGYACNGCEKPLLIRKESRLLLWLAYKGCGLFVQHDQRRRLLCAACAKKCPKGVQSEVTWPLGDAVVDRVRERGKDLRRSI